MSEATDLAAAAGSADARVGLRAVLALRRLLETLDRLQVGEGALGDADAEALRAIGIDLPAVLAKLEEAFGPGALDPPCPEPRRGLLRRRRPSAPSAGTRIPFVPRAKKVLELALRESLALGHNYIGSEHLLLGLIREGEGMAARILTEAGVSLDDLRARTIA